MKAEDFLDQGISKETPSYTDMSTESFLDTPVESAESFLDVSIAEPVERPEIPSFRQGIPPTILERGKRAATDLFRKEPGVGPLTKEDYATFKPARAMPPKQQTPGYTGEWQEKYGFMDKWREIKKEGVVPFIPFVSGAKEVKDIAQVAGWAYKLDKGTATPEEKDQLISFVQEANKDTDFWYKTLDTVSQMPAFMGEFLLTGGIYAAGKKVGTEIATKSIKKILGKSGEKLLKKKIGKIGVKIAAGIAGATLQTPVIGLPRIISGTIERSMPKLRLTEDEKGKIDVLISGEGENLLPAFTKALGDQWAETVSEHSGGFFGMLGRSAKNTVIKTGLFSAFLKTNPKVPVNKAVSFFKKMGYHGVINEMLEERLGEGLRAGLGIQEYKLPTIEQLGVELVSFSVPGVVQGLGAKAFKEPPAIKDIPPPIEIAAKQQTSSNIINMIDEGMTTGEIRGETFTPEVAMVVIKDAYADKALTNEDLDNFKEKYPDLRPRLNDLIGEKVKTEIDEQVKAAERVKAEAEEAYRRTPEGRQAAIEIEMPAPAKPTAEVVREKAEIVSEYVYHGTSEGAFRQIRKQGMKEKEKYFSGDEQYAKTYAERKGVLKEPRILRIKKTADIIPDERIPEEGDFKTKREISPEEIEIKVGKKWIPIQEYYDESINIMPIEPAKPLPPKLPKAKDNIDNLIESFEATGHIATRYPRKRQISVDGRTMNEKEAIAKMRRVVEARPPELPEAKPPEAVRKEIKAEVIPEVKPKVEKEKVEVTPEKPKYKKVVIRPSKVRTLRGAIRELGGIDFQQFKGELETMDLSIKYLHKKTGRSIDLVEMQLKEDGWLYPDEVLLDVLADKKNLSRDRIGKTVLEKPEHELSPEEIRIKKEIKWEPEEPPKGEYTTINAEDLPLGKELTLIEGKSKEGWDVYEVTAKDPFGITLLDGQEITLHPLDKVDVLKEDLKEPAEKLEKPTGVEVPEGKVFATKAITLKQLKSDEKIAIENTEGAVLDDKGLSLDVVRYQKPEQAGELSIREGVFFLPEKKSPYKKYYTTGKIGYGGSERLEGRTTYRNPYMVKAASGGRAPKLAYDFINGKGAYEKMRSEVLSKAWMKDWGRTPDINSINKLLKKYGGNPALTEAIVSVSKEGNTLPYAIQEHIVAASVRKAGYDAVIGYTKIGGKMRLSEVFDVRPARYPSKIIWEHYFEDFYGQKRLKPITTVYATKAIKPQDTITRADLKSIFAKMKNISTGVDKDGNFFFRLFGKPIVTIYEVNEVEGYIDTSKGRIPVGSFLGNTIELKTGGEGHTADIGTAWHEYEHWMEANGILSGNDVKALDTVLEKQGITPNAETRATYVGDRLSEWQSQKNLSIKRVLKKIADFVNSIWEFVSRTRTARGVLADIETGAILSEKELSAVNQFAQDVSFSIKKAAKVITDNPNFVKWFGDTEHHLLAEEDGEPRIMYRGMSQRDFDIGIIDSRKTGSAVAGYFTNLPEGAQHYADRILEGDGVVKEFYVAAENVFNDRNLRDLDEAEKKFIKKETGQTIDDLDNDVLPENKKFIKALKKLGYDAIETEGNYPHTEICPFESTQIKSIYNTGAFGITEPDIMFAIKPTVDYKEMLKRYQEAGVRKPSFQETLEAVTTEDYISNRKDSRNIKFAAATNIKRVSSEIVGGIDRFLGSISTRLGQVSPKLKAKLRRLDFDINTKYADSVKIVRPLLEKAKKMSRDDFADWDYARKNSDIAKIGELINKYSLQNEYVAYRKTLDSLRKEGLDVGLEIGEIEEYAPRILKDSRGFLTAIGKAEEWPIYSRRLQERAQEIGISVAEMPLDMKADIISNMMLGGWIGLGGIPATKQRKLEKIPAYLNKYYMDSDAALMQHLHSIRKAIEARKFFGKIPIKVAEIRKRLHVAQAKIRELNDRLKDKLPQEELEKLRKRRDKYIGLEKAYTVYIQKYALQRDYTENIGAYVIELIDKKEISPQHERMVNDILKARFHEVGTRGVVQAYKNLSYIDTMGSPISALTQIGDLAWAAYEGGLIRTLKYAYKSAIKKSRITKEDVGVTRIAQEFADPGTLGNAVSKVFKIVGLEKIDSIGKEALLNTALEKYQTKAKKEPLKLKRKLMPIFENETDSVIDDLVNNEISENVKLLVYSRLLDFQPVGLSEMPQGYLDAGNGRLFYMLKTFTIKVFDVYRNEIYYKIKKGDKAEKIQGFKNLVRLSAFFILANAGADELKDWVLGRKTDFSDRMVDNILRLFGVSKFVTWKARTEGVGSALARQVLPPFKFIDSAGKDIITAGDEKGLEVIGSIPVVGKLAYWHFGRGTSKREDLWDRRLRKRKAKLNKIKDKLGISKNKGAFRVKYKDELFELRKINSLQGRLNEYRKKINKQKSMKESSIGKKKIQKLEKERTVLIKTFLKKQLQPAAISQFTGGFPSSTNKFGRGFE